MILELGFRTISAFCHTMFGKLFFAHHAVLVTLRGQTTGWYTVLAGINITIMIIISIQMH